MTSLNPTIRVGTQIVERIRAFNTGLNRRQVSEKAEQLLEMVKLPEAQKPS